MSQTDHLFAQEALERIGQIEEAVLLERSSIHINRCGGCGGPTYHQPCAICNFYPIWNEKSTHSPAVATAAHFKSAIERSSHLSHEGTLATWYFKTKFNNNSILRYSLAEALDKAVQIKTPNAETIWNLVVVEGLDLRREAPPSFVQKAWSGLEELNQLRCHRNMDTRTAAQIGETLTSWTEALHAEDNDGIAAILEKGDRLLMQCSHLKPGNVLVARQALSQAIEEIPSKRPTP